MAITDMVVRGAGAIGATAAYGALPRAHSTFKGSDLKKIFHATSRPRLPDAGRRPPHRR